MNLEALHKNLPAVQSAALARFAAAGFPGPALEHWHYSDFSSLGTQSFSAHAASQDASWSLDAAQALAIGQAAQSKAQPLFAFDDLNLALAQTGVDTVLDGSSTLPYLLTQATPVSGGMQHWRHCVQLAAQAQATLILWDGAGHAGGDEADTLATALLQLDLAAGSQLTLIRVQAAPLQAAQATHLAATLARDATLTVFNLDFGSRRSRFEPHITLAGAGAALHYQSLTAISGRSHVDTQLRVQHAAPHCSSRVEARLIAAERSRAICNPQVVVAAGADKTDSETRCHSLLLSGKAEIDAKPELLIDADDVKCAHGATFGQLDEDAAFYLRSRGLSAAEAQGLLTLAFADSVLAQLPLPQLRDWASAKVRALLAATA